MRSYLKTRVEALETVCQPKKRKVIIFGQVAPFNYWEVAGVEINKTHIVERKGDFKDYQTYVNLQEEGSKLANEIANKNNMHIIGVGLKFVAGAKYSAKYNFAGQIPKDLKNDHLCKVYSQ